MITRKGSHTIIIYPWRFSLPVIDLLDNFQCETGFDLQPEAFGDGLEIRNLDIESRLA